jgi:hypothetical protein
VAYIFSLIGMDKIKKKPSKGRKDQALIVPAGTEQETGFTRAETEKKNGPVKIPPVTREETTRKGRKRG